MTNTLSCKLASLKYTVEWYVNISDNLHQLAVAVAVAGGLSSSSNIDCKGMVLIIHMVHSRLGDNHSNEYVIATLHLSVNHIGT